MNILSFRKINIGIIIVFALSIMTTGNKVYSQADTIMQMCTQYLVPPFVSSGQQNKALLAKNEVAEFHTTFYGGNTYRIIACSGLSEGSLIFSVYDKNRNLLYTNKNHQNAPYWDFKFNSTVDCIIEARLAETETSGFAILLIGFKQPNF